ncbi:inositol monophosphatase family protein [Thiohalobacter thiocyanaticus]|uniref:Inositol monophosphatase family protein n=1 Tax=Thiohalobacter thiocyanaticus TaxID=585455 RepID=A0A426QHY3_9GAMM|nr:inositol monophosphatase family protein [Thiohalobacter thiocyanaticus]RRQ21375.1 inositol monophosphatase family protein [Thiohalobacter thiocyanaticus]
MDINQLNTLIRQVGQEELIPRFQRIGHEYKADGSVLTEADLAVDARLREQLHALHPDVAFLSEEMPTAEQATLLADSGTPLWCLDPLDGTSNFAAGIPCFGISLALIRGGEVELGIIYDPLRDECFSARRGAGARLNDQRLQARATGVVLDKAVALVDFKRLGSPLRQCLVDNAPYSSQRNFGSCALEWGWMAAGRGHVYLHGGQKLWDLAAGSLILTEAGGTCRTLEGEAVFAPRLAPRSVVSASDPALFAAWRNWLADAQAGG